jgi:hypothetical protein
LVALLISACTSLPPLVVPTERASVRGYDAHRIARLASALVEDKAFVLARLPGSVDVPLELWEAEGAEQRRLEQLNADGLTERRRGLVLFGWGRPRSETHTRVLLLPEAERRVLTHELVHALLGPDWAPLPTALEEGLADWLAFERHPHTRGPWQHWNALLGESAGATLEISVQLGRGRGHGTSLGWSAPPREAQARNLDLTAILNLKESDPWAGLSPADVRLVYAAGYGLVERIVERHGIEGLHAACLAARLAGENRLSAPSLLALADLPAGAFPPQELAQRRDLALRQMDLLSLGALEVVVELYRRFARRGEEPQAFLARLRGRLRAAGSATVDWRDLPDFERFADAVELAVLNGQEFQAPSRRD